jgi:subtilisin family serine protease
MGHCHRLRLANVLGPIIVGVLALSFLSPARAAPQSKGGGLSKYDRALLAEARMQGKANVMVLIASKRGQNKNVASAITSAGGTIRFQDDDVDYIRAIVPTARVETLAAHTSLEALDLDEVVPLEDPRPEGVVPVIPQPAPGPSTPNNNPYLPIGDTGAAQFIAAHPTWDGRGVTVGIVDTGVDLHHPSLQITSTGERKIIDWVTYTHPFDDNDPTWVDMQDQVSGATFTYKNVTYTAPAAGPYRIGLFNERDPRLGGELGNDVNRDGNPPGSSGIFAVLWDTASNNVYVDANQNHSFADEPAMTDYKVRYDVGTFGVDNPATAVREVMPFVVQTDGKNKVVNIGIVSGAHGSHVAGIVAGNQLFGGAMSGAAPGAKLVSVRVCLFIAGCTAHALIEGMIYVAKQSNVDVINMSIGGLPALNDGNNARAVLYNRLIEQYNVQMFISAGNSGPGMNTVGDPSVASNVMSVGAYISDDTYLANYGAQLYEDDNLHYFSSRGPREDGGFKPNIVAPGAAISTTPLWQPGGPVPGTYPLPPGYSMFNGTSMAAPQATGAAALLVSAARQASAQHQPAQLRQALVSSARFLAGRYQAYEQGNGLINVGAAWDLLKQNIKTAQITSSVPVNTLLSGFLATPGIGQGIHDREGVTIGQSYTRTYTFMRTKGGSKPILYHLSWVGNDGTFSSAGTIALPLNKPVTLDVTINPATAGAHAAILNLDDPSTAGIDYQTMNVVVAADEFKVANGFAVPKSGTVGPGQVKSYFFRIPAGTPAFKVDMIGGGSTAGAGAIRFLRWHPWGLGIDSNAVSSCYNGAPGGCTTGSPTSRTVSNPQPGVWEVTVDARRNSDSPSAPFTLTAMILGASVAPNQDTLSSATLGTPIPRSYMLTNLFGAFTGRAVGTTLGSARRGVFSIGNLEVQQYPVTVAAGSTSLRATIGNPSDPAADLDLYVYNCTSGPCVLAGQSADGDSEESVTINNPAAGNWLIVIDGFAVPFGTTTYNYVDVFVNPAFGAVSLSDSNAPRPSGSSWTVSGTVTANAAPATGRVLLGNVEVRTDTNILVGSGDVIIQSVSP